jgi:hypothetical protein
MARRAPLPYPLAGSDTRTDEPLRASGSDGPQSRSRPSAVIGLVAAVTVLGLLAAVVWLVVQRSADQARIESLTQDVDQATIAAELYRSALAAVDLAGVSDSQARSIEMVVASDAIARFLEAYDPGGDPPSGGGFVRAFFDRDVKTAAWQGIPGSALPDRVLARVDRAAAPKVIWVSRRPSRGGWTPTPSSPTPSAASPQPNEVFGRAFETASHSPLMTTMIGPSSGPKESGAKK